MTTTARIRLWRRLRSFFLEERWRIFVVRPGHAPLAFRRRGEKGSRDFAADPFLVPRDGVPYLFYETTKKNSKGVLACSHLEGESWIDDGIVLEQPTHLSYPQVFQRDGAWFMIPESGAANEVALYRAADFPRRWEKVATLLTGNYADSTLWIQDGSCYLFALNHRPGGRDVLELWIAPRVEGPWTPHPRFEITASRRLARPAGRLLVADGRLWRVAQDCNGDYGKRVFRVPILRLSSTDYAEGDAELALRPPRGFAGAHTDGTVEVNGESWRIFDTKKFHLLPPGQILRNLWSYAFQRLARFGAQLTARLK